MKTLINKTAITSLTIALGALLFYNLPAQARFDYENWQPVKGRIHQQEDRLEKQLNRAYNQGMIDTLELAQLRRDLDGIKVQEDEFRMDHNGLGAKDIRAMDNKLNQFQKDLNTEEADKYVIPQRQAQAQEQQQPCWDMAHVQNCSHLQQQKQQVQNPSKVMIEEANCCASQN